MLAGLSDERLVEHVRKGDASAFEVLYDRHSEGIFGFCRHMLGSEADAEDAVQHTFIAAHADIQRNGRRELHVKAWLYTIARNRCFSMLRARREGPTDQDFEIATNGFADAVQQRADLRALLADVRQLPHDQREALVLAEVGDFSHEEIAGVLGCEVSKVKSLVFQARTALIDRRTARETPCSEIREQIATLRGGALRRSSLRHHIEICPGCAEYREQVKRQRAMLAVALPVVPSAALRSHVLGSIGIANASAAVGGAGGAGGAGLAAQGGVAAKIGIAAVLAVGGGGGAAAVVHNGGIPLLHHHSSASTHATPARAASTHRNAAAQYRVTATSARAKQSSTSDHVAKHGGHRSTSGTQHGFTPATGTSNGAAARAFAKTRGQGRHTGLTKTHTTGRSKQHAHVKHVVMAPARPLTAPRVQPAPAPKAKAPAPHAAPAPDSTTQTTTQSTTTTTTTTTTAPSPTGTVGTKPRALSSPSSG